MLENSLEDQPELSLSAGLPLPSAQGPADGAKNSGSTARFTRNAALSVGRLMVSTLVALILPAFLTHKLPNKTYSAWVLILQMSAYVSYLDFGVQSGVAKFVAEYDAQGDALGANRRASAGLAIMLAASILGVILTTILAWQVPHFFSQMPSNLYRDVRISLILVGGSLSFGLLCSVFSAIFVGLQRYGMPMVLAVMNRVLFTAVVCFSAYRNSSLAMMGAAVAAVNLLTGALQVVAWHKLAGRVRVSFGHVRYDVLKKMLAYCSVLAIWSAGMLCVTGLDVTIVGRYDFTQTGFYSIATLPTSFMIAILGAALGPLLPSGSAMSTRRTSEEMGALVTRATRYCTMLLLLTGLPLLVGAYPILRLWVGSGYALHTMGYLRILVVANILRNVCAPYSTMLVATDSQRVAIAGAVAEAIVNVASSIYLARHLGAIGVAYGTVLGSLVSVLMHFAVSMRYAHAKLAVSRTRLAADGMLRPSLIALPSLALLPLWWSAGSSTMSLRLWVLWSLATLLLTWFGALTLAERRSLIKLTKSRMKLATSYS
jgi:O-antigen/teichoic acid export membrane protein